ncbi:MAG: hypothetical protein AAFV93_00480 [Chloroflexota bacterium]
MTDISQQIKQSITDTKINNDLKQKLNQISHGDLRRHAKVWAFALLERNPQDFLNIYRQGLNQTEHRDLIIQLLDTINFHEQPNLANVLLEKLHTSDLANAYLRGLITLFVSNAKLLNTLRTMYANSSTYWYPPSYLKLDDETAFLLYKRLKKDIIGLFTRAMRYSPENPDGFPKTLGAILKNEGRSNEYYQVYRVVTNEQQFHEELRHAIKNPPEQRRYRFLYHLRPNHFHHFDIPEDLVNQLLAKFGADVENFLRETSGWYGAKVLREHIKTADNQTLLQVLFQIQRNQNALKSTEAEWAQAVFERSPSYFEKFVKYNLKNKEVMAQVLPLAKQHGQLDLYQHLYRQVITKEEQWQQAVRDILDMEKSAGETLYELDWIDITNNWNARLSDDLALRLYQLHPTTFLEFIRRHVTVRSTQGFEYPQLRDAIVQEDEETWWQIFREVATIQLWQESLDDLLQVDVPADQIADELEKRHPTKLKPPTSSLQPFLEKYGDALRPYLERHVKLLTEKRLKQLLALDLDRATLRQELEMLSRRQPRDFQNMIHIWLPALYDGNSNFWDTLILRNMLWRLPEKHNLDGLIEQMETDGKYRLFTAFYNRIKTQDEWNQDIVQLANSDLDDEALMEAIRRRRMWGDLNDASASVLYQRNSEVFREFILERLGYHRQRQTYPNLIKLAENNDDKPILQRLRNTDNKSNIATKALTDDDITAQDAIDRIEESARRYRNDEAFAEQMMQAFERFGEPLLDIMTRYRYSWNRYIDQSRFEAKLANIYDPARDEGYWRVFFMTVNFQQWTKALHDLLKTVEDDDELFRRLQLMTPHNYQIRGRWQLDPNIAYELARRDKVRAYPFIKAHSVEFSEPLFKLAVEMDDLNLIDTVIYRTLVNWRNDNPQMVTDYLQNLLETQSEQFVQRASNILGQISAFEIYRRDVFLARPIYKILVQPRDLWLQSSDAIRDLLESPSIYIIYMGLELLAESGQLSADHTLENLAWIRWFLLGRAKRNTKALALDALYNASQHGYANEVIKVIEATKDFQGKRAIDDKLIVAYGRLQRQLRTAEEE